MRSTVVSATRIIVVEDEPLFREMLRSQLSNDPEIEVVGEAETGELAIELAKALQPEVILMDIELGEGITGIQAGYAIKADRPTTGIVLLSNHRAKQFIVTSAGWSYLIKRNVRNFETVARAIKGAAWGMIVIDPFVTDVLKPREDTALSRLTIEELKVLELVTQGFSDAAISMQMIVSEDKVRSYFNGIVAKLEIKPDGQMDPRVAVVRAYLEQTRDN